MPMKDMHYQMSTLGHHKEPASNAIQDGSPVWQTNSYWQYFIYGTALTGIRIGDRGGCDDLLVACCLSKSF